MRNASAKVLWSVASRANFAIRVVEDEFRRRDDDEVKEDECCECF